MLSRLGYYLAGVRFDARPILHFYQFVDPQLLKHRLLESMYYLHVQPPGLNLYIGIALKLFPRVVPDRAAYRALSDGTNNLLADLLLDARVRSKSRDRIRPSDLVRG